MATQIVDKREELKLNILKHLQQSYKVIDESRKQWEEVVGRCQTHIESVNNLTEQMSCCSKVPDSSITELIQDLPDVRDKLMFKLQNEINKRFLELKKELNILQDIFDKVSKQCSQITSAYNRNKGALNIETVSKATCNTPSIASMMKWLQHIERLLHQRLCARKFLLQTYNAANTSTHFTGDNIWTSNDQDITRIINDYMGHLIFFMDKKF